MGKTKSGDSWLDAMSDGRLKKTLAESPPEGTVSESDALIESWRERALKAERAADEYRKWVADRTHDLMDRDFDWWAALCLNDAVDATPEAVKAYRLALEADALHAVANALRAVEEREKRLLDMLKAVHPPHPQPEMCYACVVILTQGNAGAPKTGGEGE